MSTKAKVRPRRKVSRTIRLTRPITHDSPGVFIITQNGKQDAYTVVRIPSDQGVAFEVGKQAFVPVDPEVGWERRELCRYSVLIDSIASQCECAGFLRFGHCRHVSGLQALLAEGKLKCSAEPEDPGPAQPKPVEPAQPQKRDCVHEPIPGREDEHSYGPFGDENADGFCAP